MTKPRPCGCKGCRTCLICETQYGAENLKLQLELDKSKGYVFCPFCNKSWRGWDIDSYKQHPNHEGDSIDIATEHDILKKNKFHPYHVTRVQTLQPRDYAARLRFCRQMLAKIEEDPQFFNKILWSDESTFKRDGYMNLRNLHGWELENPILCVKIEPPLLCLRLKS
ncbi:hypothetical protein PYW08_003622 [Mythimna loreyi]|uniref:Uncharacterized protein n=1 Tax=Mythimna loreyi TaxID=667449 RepID=A0ACC2QYB2_9NEOP|nr:hypothetical protein PYW08_003622 [Mythimna loreyi]